MKKTLIALSAAFVVAGSAFALADPIEETKADIYPDVAIYMQAQQARGYDAFAAARQPARSAVRGTTRWNGTAEMELFGRVDNHGF